MSDDKPTEVLEGPPDAPDRAAGLPATAEMPALAGGSPFRRPATQVIAEDVRTDWQVEPSRREGDAIIAASPLELPRGPARYEVIAELARGSMGMIQIVRDRALERLVALKSLLPGTGVPNAATRFLDEARITAQLQHPGTVAVYEIDVDADGQPYFTMQLVEGETLRGILEGIKQGMPEILERFNRVRLLNIFMQLCMAVACAHSRGVIHRDLKPDNVMLGEFGEVFVMDWGLAKIIHRDLQDAVIGGRPDRAEYRTQVGEITGTPSYMSPEQAMGLIDTLSARSDIFSLGAILYELLTLRPPFEGPSVEEVLRRVRRESPAPPSKAAPTLGVPPELDAIVMRCLARRQEDRYHSASELRDAVERWLGGAQDAAKQPPSASSALREAARAAQAFKDLARRRRRIAREVAELRSIRLPDDSKSRRRRRWDRQAHLESLVEDTAAAFESTIAHYRQILLEQPSHPEALNGLRDTFWYRSLEAERLDDAPTHVLFAALARLHDPSGTLAAAFRGDGSLRITCVPASAQLTLFEHEERHQRLEPRRVRPPQPCGAALALEPLPMGSYLVLLEAEGHEPTRVPIQIRRQAATEISVRMLRRGQLPRGYLHIADGVYRAGATNPELAAMPRSLRHLKDFLIAREPVTVDAYVAFLNALAQTEPGRAAEHAPPEDVIELTSGRYQARAAGECPVTGVRYQSALAFCRALSEADGRTHRLPTEEEWEKAARGADGRAYPWGDRWEPAFCVCAESVEEGRPGPVSNATDESPFGVRDLAGGVREWTATTHPRQGRRQAVKGGSFRAGRTGCHLAFRRFERASTRADDLGFRVALDFESCLDFKS